MSAISVRMIAVRFPRTKISHTRSLLSGAFQFTCHRCNFATKSDVKIFNRLTQP